MQPLTAAVLAILLLVALTLQPAAAFRRGTTIIDGVPVPNRGQHMARANARRMSLTPPMPLSATHHVRQSADVDVFNVLDYGAKADNSSDNTAAFAAAINAAKAANGGIVFAPAGLYHFAGSLVLPSGVELQGSYSSVPSHACVNGLYPGDGTTLMPTAGRGNDSAQPFITVSEDAAVRGLVIWHVNQLPTSVPVPYPFAVALVGNNAAITDVELLNAWNGISAVQAHRHYIARIQGQPLNIGVFVDQTYDIGRIEDVHFNPWFSNNKVFVSWQTTYGRSFVFGRSDWEYVFNTFSFAYAYGYHFIQTSTGTMNGNFLGLGADYACNASVQVDAAQAPGLLFTNGEFTSFHNGDFAPNSTAISAQVVVGPNNTGPVQFVTSSFWGPGTNIARLSGQGTTTFSSCVFSGWDAYNTDAPAILATSGSVIVTSSTFQQASNQIELTSGVAKAIITGNLFAGPEKITNNANQTQIAMNVFG